MQYRKLCIVISFLSLQIVASNRYDRNILPTVSPEFMEERALRKEIAWKNKVAYVAPLVATAIGSVASFEPLLRYEYDDSTRNAKSSFVYASPIVALGITCNMPKSVCVNFNDTIYDLRRKSKQCDDNIQRGAALGLVRGVCLPGTLVVGLLGIFGLLYCCITN